MKISACNEFFENWEIERVFEYAAEIGYDGVELAPFTLASSVEDIPSGRRDEIRRAAERSGVEIVGLHWLLVSPEGLYMNHPDEKIRLATRDYFIQLIHCCGDLGGKVMVIGSPKQRNVQEGWDYDQTWDLTKQTFVECLDAAAARDVTLCMEPLSPALTNFIQRGDEAVKMVQEIGHPNFRMMIDVCSGSTEEKPVPQVLREVKDYLAHVHVNDPNGRGPGFGDVGFVPILQTLKDIGYDGYISVEVFDFEPDPETIATKSLVYLKECLAQVS